jgi:hypothetical protein
LKTGFETTAGGIGAMRIIRNAAVVLALALAPACVIPADIEPPPPEPNYGPIIMLDTVSPAGPLVSVDSSCRVTFNVGSITEPNSGDTLYYRWYVDYDIYGYFKQGGSLAPPSDGSLTRKGPMFILDASSSLTFIDRSRGSAHTLELIVADRPFDDNPLAPPPYKVVTDGGLKDYFSWTVKLRFDCSSSGL